MIRRIMLVLCLAIIAMKANAMVYNPTNGHYYEAVSGQYSWTEAVEDTSFKEYQGVQGYLATLTSQAENDWVWNNVMPEGTPSWYLLGGLQTPGSNEPADGWNWMNGETWSYTNWNIPNEPNNAAYANENVIQFWNNGKWNDMIGNDSTTNYGDTKYYAGYIVEYQPAASPVPEPMTMSLMGLGLAGAGLFRKYAVKKS